MSEHQSGPVELGAPMDYREHEKTYAMFINLSKYATMIITMLMVAMAAGFFGGFGFLSALILFVLLSAVGIVALR
jgi:Bacterial aa3 type cytochrome c oxidase subunit IV